MSDSTAYMYYVQVQGDLRGPVFLYPVLCTNVLISVCWLSVDLRPHAETVGLLGPGAQDVHLNFHTAPELSKRSDTDTDTDFIDIRP